jgi:hypothetical protein
MLSAVRFEALSSHAWLRQGMAGELPSGSIPTFASHLPQLRLQMLEYQEPLETLESSGA